MNKVKLPNYINAGLALFKDIFLQAGNTVIETPEGLVCIQCRLPIDQCNHYHGEWQCKHCHEWTYPFYYDISDGCSHCGSTQVMTEDLNPGDELDESRNL